MIPSPGDLFLTHPGTGLASLCHSKFTGIAGNPLELIKLAYRDYLIRSAHKLCLMSKSDLLFYGL